MGLQWLNDRREANPLENKRMNFIFFFPDEMRAESLACYGHPVVKTPNFNRLAEEGVCFEQCYTQHTVCSPSRCSLMTGWYPHVSGHRTLWHLLRPHEPSLFRYLKKAGYQIKWYGKNDLYSPEYLKEILGEELNSLEEHHARFTAENPFHEDEAPFYSFLYEPKSRDEDSTETASSVHRATRFLRSKEAKEKPFLIFLPTEMPHPPYAAPQSYHNMYKEDEISKLRPANLSRKPIFYKLIREYRRLDKMPERLLQKIQAVYLGMISYVDREFGQLMEVLHQSGLADQTTVIVSSDHGDWAGDFGLVEKWPSGMDDTLIRVPLIIRSPGNSAGHVVKEQVELFDIMATILDLAGIQSEHTHFARSLVTQLHGAAGDPQRAVFAEGGYDPHELHCFEGYPPRLEQLRRPSTHMYFPKLQQQQEIPKSVCRSTMIRTLEYKLVRRTADVNELYDLRKDPFEIDNVYFNPSYAEIRSKLESRLLDWYIHTADTVPLDENPRGFPHPHRT